MAISYAANNSSGSLLVAQLGMLSNTASVTSITDSAGNTWQQAVGVHGGSNSSEIWYAANARPGANRVTARFSVSTTAYLELSEWANVASVTPLDRIQSAANSGTTTVASGNTVVSSEVGELAIFNPVWSANTSGKSLAASGGALVPTQTGWTDAAHRGGTTGLGGEFAYGIAGTAQSGAWGATLTGAAPNCATLAIFRPLAAPPAPAGLRDSHPVRVASESG